MLKLAGRGPAHTPEALAAAIAAAQQEAEAARAEAQRLITASAAELDDEKAEALLAQSRAQERAADRAEARMPELREQLAATVWADKEKAFRRCRRDLTSAAREAIKKLEAAAEANFTLAKLRDAASRELGNHVTQIPLLLYAGLLLPDLVAIWRKHTERALEVLEQAELPRRAVPTPVNDTRPGPVFPRPGSVVAARVSSQVAAPSAAEAAQERTLPVPNPVPKRQERHDGPPAPGQRQIKFLRGGTFTLPDGSHAAFGDRVNLPEADAEKIVWTGSADFVDASEAVIGDVKMEVSVSDFFGRRR